MSLTVLLIVGCLSGDPSQCKNFKTTLDEHISVQQCFMGGPTQIAQWSEQNPGWDFKRLTCTTDREISLLEKNPL